MCHGICPCLGSTHVEHVEKHIHAVGICLQRGSFISPPHRGSVARCEVCADRRELGLIHISTLALLFCIVASWPPCKLQFLLLWYIPTGSRAFSSRRYRHHNLSEDHTLPGSSDLLPHPHSEITATSFNSRTRGGVFSSNGDWPQGAILFFFFAWFDHKLADGVPVLMRSSPDRSGHACDSQKQQH